MPDDTWKDRQGNTWRRSDDTGLPITVTQPEDPAFILLNDSHTTSPTVYRSGCYICEDPEFAQMGLPLCRACPECQKAGRGTGHIAADDNVCDECGYDQEEEYAQWMEKQGPTRGDDPDHIFTDKDDEDR